MVGGAVAKPVPSAPQFSCSEAVRWAEAAWWALHKIGFLTDQHHLTCSLQAHSARSSHTPTRIQWPNLYCCSGHD